MRVDSLAMVRLRFESYFSLVFTSRFLQFIGVANFAATDTSYFIMVDSSRLEEYHSIPGFEVFDTS